MHFLCIEYTNFETEALPDNFLYSSTWERVLDRIQVLNGKEVEPNMEASAGTRSSQYLATLRYTTFSEMYMSALNGSYLRLFLFS